MIASFHHVAISTPNFDRCINFCCGLLGMELLVDTPFAGEIYKTIMAVSNAEGRAAMLRLGDFHLEIFEFSKADPSATQFSRPVSKPGFTHICFCVSDIEYEYQRLSDQGISFHCPPQNFGAAKATYGRDPDGNIFELNEREVDL